MINVLGPLRLWRNVKWPELLIIGVTSTATTGRLINYLLPSSTGS